MNLMIPKEEEPVSVKVMVDGPIVIKGDIYD